jgi:hypothetical protein
MMVQFRREMAVKVGSVRGSVEAKTIVRIMEATMPLGEESVMEMRWEGRGGLTRCLSGK